MTRKQNKKKESKKQARSTSRDKRTLIFSLFSWISESDINKLFLYARLFRQRKHGAEIKALRSGGGGLH